MVTDGKRFSSVRGYIDLIRPFTLLAPIIVSFCIIIASMIYNGINEGFFFLMWSMILPASFTMAILNAASNALNQATDYEADKLSKPYRPIPRGIVNRERALQLSFVLYFLALLLSMFIHSTFTLFVFSISLFSVTYSLPPRMKDKLFINQLWIAIPRGLLGVLASWSVFGSPFQVLPLTIGMIAMCFLIGGSITKDITDSEADKKTGTQTWVNTYGVKMAAFMALPFMFFPFVSIPVMIQNGLLESYFWLLTFLAIPAYLIFHLMIRDDSKSKILENTSAWSLMYVTYFIFAICFSLLTIVGVLFIS
jgi:geranylgeranylglycerol-phosphate geranylgeranyltransferase